MELNFACIFTPSLAKETFQIPRGAAFKQAAEIIPVEPGQGNACAGKVVQVYLASTFRSRSIFSQINFITGSQFPPLN